MCISSLILISSCIVVVHALDSLKDQLVCPLKFFIGLLHESS